MEAEFTYTNKEVIALVLEKHCQVYSAPVGMEWTAVLKYSDEVVVTLIKVKNKQAEVQTDDRLIAKPYPDLHDQD